MTVSEVLAELHQREVILSVDGNHLRVDAPRGILTPEMKDALRQLKGDILALLAGSACTCDPLPSQGEHGALAQAGVGPAYQPCNTCGYTWRCRLCGGCRRCRMDRGGRT